MGVPIHPTTTATRRIELRIQSSPATAVGITSRRKSTTVGKRKSVAMSATMSVTTHRAAESTVSTAANLPFGRLEPNALVTSMRTMISFPAVIGNDRIRLVARLTTWSVALHSIIVVHSVMMTTSTMTYGVRHHLADVLHPSTPNAG